MHYPKMIFDLHAGLSSRISFQDTTGDLYCGHDREEDDGALT